MLNAIIAGQAVGLSPLLRPPSQLFGSAPRAFSSTTSSAINIALGQAAQVNAVQTTTSNATLLTVTGKGVLLFCAFHNGNAGAQCIGTVTIDGVVVYNAVASGYSSIACAAGWVSAVDGAAGTSTFGFEAIPFLSSLLIQYKSDTASQQVGAAAKYRLSN